MSLLLTLASPTDSSGPLEFTDFGNYAFTPTQENCFIQCWGCGGAGVGSAKGGTGVGGGGGAYSEGTVTLDTNLEYTVVVDYPYTALWYSDGINPNVVFVSASAGNNAGPGTGGQAADCIGDMNFNGGDGGFKSPDGFSQGGGGGSSAGPANNGVVGEDGEDDSSGGQGGIAPSGGGDGGSTSLDAEVRSGKAPGGGGCGAGVAQSIGAGAPGKVIITYV